MLAPAVRYGIPAAFVLAGFVVLVLDNDAWVAWAGFVGAGIAVLLLNVLFRMSFQGEADRDREQEARDFFDRHGRWPDQQERRAREWRLPEGAATPESEKRDRDRRR
ncbi:MAG TPA: hypothetical protein VK304_14900 [Thermoleophilaceae bacterium]|nr:hypothetical protein [Thermoleophilaceae bacterium]